MKIIELDHHDQRFYPLLGRYLANRQVVEYLGGTLWDDEGKTWFVALKNGARDGIQEVLGFAAVASRNRGRRLHLESMYLPEQSPPEIGPALVAAAITRFRDHHLYARVRRDHADAHLSAGFTEVGGSTNFVDLVRVDT